MDASPAVSVVATVRNERATVGPLLDGLAAQTRRPDEVVIVDGGSVDGTHELLCARAAAGDLPLRVLARPGANISAGRNAAIEAAQGPVIASTDAGVRFPPTWLEALTAPFADGARMVSGFFETDPTGAFETALGATTLPERSEIDPGRFLPSSRSVAFLKADWAAVGGYPEWLDYCEDLVFDLRLIDRTGAPRFAPSAVVRFRPRQDLAAFVRKYYRYARGDGKANLWPVRHLVRYLTYAVGVPGLAALAAGRHPAFALALMVGLGAMVRRPYRRLVRQWGPLDTRQRLAAAVWVPVIRVAGDSAKLAGYPAGWRWRLAHRPPEWRPRPGVGWR